MSDNGHGEFEVIEEVRADSVNITQGGAGHVEATTVDITQGGAQVINAEQLSVTQGGALVAEAGDADFTMSGAGFLTADNVEFKSSGAGIVVADTFKADGKSVIGFLFAGTIEGEPDVKVDARTAAISGAAFAVVLFVLRRLFTRG